jgi:DNA repair exonuclease SbcCD nuclease subunit
MVFGDIHKPQTLCDNPLVAYVGSPDKITFGESTEDKRFLVYDTDAATFQSIPIPTRNFLDIAVDLKGRSIALKGCVNGDLPLGDGDYMVCLRAFFKAIGSTVVGSVLKFSVSGHKNDIDQLIRYEITSSLKALNPATIKAVTFNVTDNTAVRDNAYSTALSDMEAFKLWLSKQDYTDAVRAEVANAATDLLNSK